jgi:DNA-binding response OmpR family regulator
MSHVLIVEDDLATQFAMRKLFSLEGWDVSQSRTVAAALPLLDPAPDWIVLDLGLADGSGEDVLRHVRAASIPSGVIVLSGQVDDDRLAVLRPLKPDFVFQKPIHFDDLLKACRGGPGPEDARAP